MFTTLLLTFGYNMKIVIVHPSLISIFKQCSVISSLDNCSNKEYQKFTDHGRKLPNHSKHKANIKKGKFP